MTPQWANATIEAWTLDDGTLVVRRKQPLQKPDNGFNHCYIVDCLPKVDERKVA